MSDEYAEPFSFDFDMSSGKKPYIGKMPYVEPPFIPEVPYREKPEPKVVDKSTFENVQLLISEECNSIRDLLISKNAQYGNSAIQPKRIFSNQSSIEQIKVRIDDKLSRIQNFSSNDKFDTDSEDAVKDLIGYLILLRVAKRVHGE